MHILYICVCACARPCVCVGERQAGAERKIGCRRFARRQRVLNYVLWICMRSVKRSVGIWIIIFIISLKSWNTDFQKNCFCVIKKRLKFKFLCSTESKLPKLRVQRDKMIFLADRNIYAATNRLSFYIALKQNELSNKWIFLPKYIVCYIDTLTSEHTRVTY